jgi:hypothetical protein
MRKRENIGTFLAKDPLYVKIDASLHFTKKLLPSTEVLVQQ